MVAPVAQGVVNRLRCSVVFADFPELTVTSPYMTKEAVTLSFQGAMSQLLPTMTGGVGSPEPYVMAEITMHLVRSQNLADAYKQQIETDCTMGSINVIPDSAALDNWQLESAIITGMDALTFDGNTPSFVVKMQAIYYINQSLWDSA